MVEEERFQTFADDGTPLGLIPRSRVHRVGLWHRAANVLLLRSSGKLLLQQRAADKDICPGRWDLSAAEHLKPGESFRAGAQRGLHEELGLDDVELEPLGGVRRVVFADPAAGVLDRELQQTFRGITDAPVQPDPQEVDAVREVDVAALERELNAAPDRFTPWFADLTRTLKLFA